jgi:hypothetical protein
LATPTGEPPIVPEAHTARLPNSWRVTRSASLILTRQVDLGCRRSSPMIVA